MEKNGNTDLKIPDLSSVSISSLLSDLTWSHICVHTHYEQLPTDILLPRSVYSQHSLEKVVKIKL